MALKYENFINWCKIQSNTNIIKSHRHARVKGIKYIDNEPFRDVPSHFNSSRKRSVWTYELANV